MLQAMPDFSTLFSVTVQREVRIEDWIDDLGEEIQSRLGITGGDQASHSTSYSAVMRFSATSDRCKDAF